MIEKGHQHDTGIDIWSVGVLAFELLTGYAPFTPLDADQKQADEIEEETKFNIKVLFFFLFIYLFALECEIHFPKRFSTNGKGFYRENSS